MPIGDTFAALHSVHGPGLVPALVAALESRDIRLMLPAARVLSLNGGAEGHLRLMDRISTLPPEVVVEAAAGVSSMRASLMGAAQEADLNRRTGAVRLLELYGDVEACEPLAEFLADAELGNRAAVALQALIAKFASQRSVHLPTGSTTVGIERARVLSRALRTALEKYPQHQCEFLPLEVLRLGSDFRPIMTEALRLELAHLRDEPGPLERFLTASTDAPVLDFLVDRLTDPVSDIRSAAKRIWRGKRGDDANKSFSTLLEGIDEARLQRALVAGAGALPPMMLGNLDLYSTAALQRLTAVFERVPTDQATRIQFYLLLGESRNPDIAARCRTKLAGFPADNVAAPLLRQTASGQPRSAVFALTMLSEMGHPGALKAASDMLRADRPDLRDAAAHFVAERAYRRYLAGFEQMSDSERRNTGAMLHLVDDDVIEELRRQICAAEPEVRLRALRILDYTHNAPRLRQSIIDLMHDPDARVRASVVGMLSALRSAEAAGAIAALLNDPDARVRANAIEAVEALGDKSLARALVPYLEDANNRIRGNAAKALYLLGVHEAASVMESMLQSDAELMRMSAIWAIRQTRPPGSEAWLRARQLVETHEGVRDRLNNALRAMGEFSTKVVRTTSVTRQVVHGGAA